MTVKLWDAETGQLVETIKVKDRVWCVRFAPEGKRVVTAGDKAAKVWDITSTVERYCV